MANYAVIPGTIGNDVQPTNPGFVRRSLKRVFRIGHKKVRTFLIVPAGAAISETISVPNGRKAEVWAINVGALNVSAITVTPTSVGANTSYAVADATQDWTGKHLLLVVEVGY